MLENSYPIRTDLALESQERLQEDQADMRGIRVLEERRENGVIVSTVMIETENASVAMGRPKGTYITIEAPEMIEEDAGYHRDISLELAKIMRNLLPGKEIEKNLKKGLEVAALVVGLGNDKVTPDAVRYGNSLLYVDFSMYLFLGFVFVVRNCVQGIGRSGFVLGAGAAELVARITVCLVLPGLFAGGAVSADAPAMAFYALCAADPMAWIAADTVLCIPFFRNILKKNYGYLRSGRA